MSLKFSLKKQNSSSFVAAALFAVACVFPLEASTVFVGPGTDIEDVNNWSNGLPTIASPGIIGGVHSSVYTDSEALSDSKLTLKDNASLAGEKARVTDGIIVLDDQAVWTDSSTQGVILGNLEGLLNETTLRVRGSAFFRVTKGSLTVGNKQQAQLYQSGGEVDVAKNLTIGKNASASDSLYQIRAGSTHIGQSVSIKNSSTLRLKGAGSMLVDGNIKINGAGSLLRIRNQADLHVLGRVSLDNSGSKVLQTGGDTVIDSKLLLNQTGGVGSSYVLKGGRLRVKDKIKVTGDNVFIWKSGGVIAVHTSASYINYEGDLTAQSGAVLELDGKTEYLDVLGTLTLNGLEIKGYDLMLYQYANTDGVTAETGCHLLVEADTLVINTVTFTGFTDSLGTLIDMGDLFDPQTDTVYWFDTTSDPQRIKVCWSVAAVPEPSSLANMGVFALSVLFFRRRRPRS